MFTVLTGRRGKSVWSQKKSRAIAIFTPRQLKFELQLYLDHSLRFFSFVEIRLETPGRLTCHLNLKCYISWYAWLYFILIDLQEEREKYRKNLENELKKLQQAVVDGMVAFDEQLFQLHNRYCTKYCTHTHHAQSSVYIYETLSIPFLIVSTFFSL